MPIYFASALSKILGPYQTLIILTLRTNGWIISYYLILFVFFKNTRSNLKRNRNFFFFFKFTKYSSFSSITSQGRKTRNGTMQLKYGKITYKAFLSPIRPKIDLYMSYQCLHVYRAKFTSIYINLYLYTNNNNKITRAIGRQKKNSPCLACLKIPILSKSLHASKAH